MHSQLVTQLYIGQTVTQFWIQDNFFRCFDQPVGLSMLLVIQTLKIYQVHVVGYKSILLLLQLYVNT